MRRRGGLRLGWRAHWRRDPSPLTTPACEEVRDGHDYGQGRQYEYSDTWVHPVEGLPSAESGYVLIPKTVRGRPLDPPLLAPVRSMAADQFESSKLTGLRRLRRFLRAQHSAFEHQPAGRDARHCDVRLQRMAATAERFPRDHVHA